MAIKWKRLCAGEYTATHGPHEFSITHRQRPDSGNGYGRIDDWVLRHTGPDGYGETDNDYPSDPMGTLRDAKAEAEAIVKANESYVAAGRKVG